MIEARQRYSIIKEIQITGINTGKVVENYNTAFQLSKNQNI